MTIKKIIERGFLLSYPIFSEIMTLHIDDIKIRLGGVIRGKWEVHSSFLTQVNPRLMNYTTTLKKIFSIIETLKENYVPFY